MEHLAKLLQLAAPVPPGIRLRNGTPMHQDFWNPPRTSAVVMYTFNRLSESHTMYQIPRLSKEEVTSLAFYVLTANNCAALTKNYSINKGADAF